MKEVCSPANSSFPNSKVGSPNLGLSPGARSMPGARNPGADSVPAPPTHGSYPVRSHSTEPPGTARVTGPDD
jgi:hypothetical protein